MGGGGLDQKKRKKAINKDPTTSKRNQAKEWKVHEKSFKKAMKQELSPDPNSLKYAKWGVLETKTKQLPIQI